MWEYVPKTHRKIILEEIKAEKGMYGTDSMLWDDFLKWEKE